jgi:aryl-alcohol dehydrogenase-like predicted oxidoreductase
MEGIEVIAYSPLAQGLLTGKFQEDFQPTDSIRRDNPLFNLRNLRQALKVVKFLEEIASDRGKTPTQVALNWLIQQSVVAIPGAKRPNLL